MSKYGLTASGANTEPLGVRRKDRLDNSAPTNGDMSATGESRDKDFINDTAPFTINGDYVNVSIDEPSNILDNSQPTEKDPRDDESRRHRKRGSRSRSHDRHHKRHREKHRKRSRSQSRDRSEKRRRSRSRERKRDRRSRDRDRDSNDDYRNGGRRQSYEDRPSQRRDLSGRDYESQHQATFGPALPPVTPSGMTNVGFNTSVDGGSNTDFSFMKQPGTPGSQGSAEGAGRKRKSRWSKENEKAFVPGMPTMLPSNLTDEQRNAYLLQLQIEDITRKLRTSDLGIPANPEERSPSPEPVYDNHGKRLNTREVRVRAALETKRHQLILDMQKMNPIYKPPPDYKPPTTKLNAKVFIPQDRHPEINFVGLLIGPRGITLKQLETDTGARIIIRGKGSVKEGKIAKRDGPLPGEDEPLHAYITASDSASIEKAVKKIEDTIRQTLEVPDGENDFRKEQLRQLALLNGTLRPEDMALSLNRCSNCGANTHKSWECPDKPNVTANIYCTSCGGAGHIAKDCKNQRPGGGVAFGAALDDEYSALMAELGEGGAAANGGGVAGAVASKPIMRVNLARPRPPPLMSVPIGSGPPMMPPAAGAPGVAAPWMPMPGMGAPPMWGGWPPMPPTGGPAGLMPPPPPPMSSSGVEDMKIDDPTNSDGTNNEVNGALPPPPPMPSMMMGANAAPPPPWPMPPMMPPFPMFPMGGTAPPPPPPPPTSSANDSDNINKDQAHLFMPPPPPPPP